MVKACCYSFLCFSFSCPFSCLFSSRSFCPFLFCLSLASSSFSFCLPFCEVSRWWCCYSVLPARCPASPDFPDCLDFPDCGAASWCFLAVCLVDSALADVVRQRPADQDAGDGCSPAAAAATRRQWCGPTRRRCSSRSDWRWRRARCGSSRSHPIPGPRSWHRSGGMCASSVSYLTDTVTIQAAKIGVYIFLEIITSSTRSSHKFIVAESTQGANYHLIRRAHWYLYF